MPPMKNHIQIAAALFAVCLICCLAPRAHAAGWPNNNDSIFPALPAAKPYITFDGRGFIVRGKRTFIVAGELQYPRTPRALWRDRLLRIKRAGYNTVQTYVFWNYHEPIEGKFEFTGEKDFGAYLKLIHSMGLYAIVRMGPYVNAEWDTGGLPVWLRFHPGLRPMSNNAQFYKAVTPYFNHLVPILVANQINHGGPILMVQMENEHVFPGGVGGGTDLPNPYYKWYYAKMRAMGLQIPLFFSGLNHSDNPAGDAPLDTSRRTSPWYSSEFWTGWVGRYGYDADRAGLLERSTWKVIAYGGAGYTHYTMAGGTDFDTWNNDEQASSYDFGSPIGQSGDLRLSYYACKKAAMFAAGFGDLLDSSLPSAGSDGVIPTGGSLQATSRKGPAGDAVFLYNRTGSPVATQIKVNGKAYPAAGPISVASGEFVPIVRNYLLAPGIRLSLAAARLLGIARHCGALTTLVVYGNPGEPAELHFSAAHAKAIGQSAGVTASGTGVVLQTTIPKSVPRVSVFESNGQTVRVLVMPTATAERTWFLENDSLIACGPDYAGAVKPSPTGIRLDTEQNGLGAKPAQPALLYLPDVAKPPLKLTPVTVSGPKASATPPALGLWKADASVPQAQPGFSDAGWKTSPEPLPMGADSGYGAYAWYRTTVTVPATGTYQLNLSDADDWISCFVNGKHAESVDVRSAPRTFPVTLQAGANTVAFLAAHYGRDKLFNYYGPLDTAEAKWKGIIGPVTLTQGAGSRQELNAFRWQADDQAPGDAAKMTAPDLDVSGPGWQDASTTTDAFGGRIGWAWFRAILPNVPGPHRNVFFHSVDDSGIVCLNGHPLSPNVGLNSNTTLSLDSAWRDGGPNVLAVAVQNTGGPGGLTGEVRLDYGLQDGPAVTGWKMRGGVSYPAYQSPQWKPLTAAGSAGIPTFYHAVFSDIPPGASGPHPVLRVSTAGLSQGFVWLNGRNLGRYPEKSPVDGVYLPESILRPGANDLVIFDEDGNAPSSVKIIVEAAASRTGYVLGAKPWTTSAFEIDRITVVNVNSEQAAEFGLSQQRIANLLRNYLDPEVKTSIRVRDPKSGKQYYLHIRLESRALVGPHQIPMISDCIVACRNGRPIRLGEIAAISDAGKNDWQSNPNHIVLAFPFDTIVIN